MSGDQKRIVVVGAGFGGLTFCQHFEHPNASLTLLDRTNHHLFQPLLYQVAMAGLSAPDIAQPIRSILSPKPRLEVRMEEVTGFDLNTRQVVTQTHRHSYDYLVLAFGGVTGYFGHPEWEEYAPGLKTLEDALLIRRNVLLAFERAETAASPLEQERLTTIVVVGGGPTGVELAGACAELAHRVLKRDFDHLDPTRSRIILIEALPRILSQFPEDLSKKAESQLRKLGVQVRTSCAVKSISQGKITLANDEAILAENILWGAGVMARPLTKQLGVDLDKAGRVMVNPDYRSPAIRRCLQLGTLLPSGNRRASLSREWLRQLCKWPVMRRDLFAMRSSVVPRVVNDELSFTRTKEVWQRSDGQRESHSLVESNYLVLLPGRGGWRCTWCS
jgi:NADH dehydrogenase